MSDLALQSSLAPAMSNSPPPWGSYLALGDSFTEGMCDWYDGVSDHAGPNPEVDLLPRGWADRLAATLTDRRREAGLEPVEYGNLAIRGRLLGQIIEEQLPIALEARPELVSLIGGGNDLLRPNLAVETISDELEQAVIKLRATGADVLLGTGFKAGGALKFTRAKTAQFNADVWAIARRHGCFVLDMWSLTSLADLRLWAEDRLHLTGEGHRRVMSAALVGLGLMPDDAEYDQPLPEAPALSRAEKARVDAEWAREHVVPWVQRRLRQQSSGDGRTPKWATLAPWPPEEISGYIPAAPPCSFSVCAATLDDMNDQRPASEKIAETASQVFGTVKKAVCDGVEAAKPVWEEKVVPTWETKVAPAISQGAGKAAGWGESAREAADRKAAELREGDQPSDKILGGVLAVGATAARLGAGAAKWVAEGLDKVGSKDDAVCEATDDEVIAEVVEDESN